MALELLESLSLPGDASKANEDAFAQGPQAAVVLDGATPLGDPLMPGNSDAQWIATFGARRLLAHLADGEGARKALRGALGDAEKSFNALRRGDVEEVWQTPCASMMLATEISTDLPPLRARGAQEGEVAETGAGAERLRDSRGRRGLDIEFLWFGDCAALLQQDGAVTVIGETLNKKAAESATAAKAAKDHARPSTDRQHHMAVLRQRRNQINSGNYWLFSPDARAATHVSRRIVKVTPGALLLLASDGFLALASDYGAYSADSLMQAVVDRGLEVLGEELRAIENADALGEKFPRFKTSDDATALLLKVS